MELNGIQLGKKTRAYQTSIMLTDAELLLLNKLVENLRGTKSQIFRLGLKMVNESLNKFGEKNEAI